jgi:hypothetical protein
MMPEYEEEMMSRYVYNGPEDMKLIKQKGIKQYFFSQEPTHNSVWDTSIDKDDKVWLSISSEFLTCGYARLYEYDYIKNDATLQFKIEDVILPQDRAIRASKYHTSISFMNDGRICMTSHTTDKAPAHPTWLPEAYYGHIWEGFAGSHILVYDPKTKLVQNLGIPAPRETLYGSVYDPKHNCLYSIGFIKGFLYRYSFDDKRVMNLGKVGEGHSFRMVLGPDDNIIRFIKIRLYVQDRY